jgi:hypothetical protein
MCLYFIAVKLIFYAMFYFSKKIENPIFKTFLGNPFLDIYKCPFSTFQNTFDFFKIENMEKDNLYQKALFCLFF